MKYIPLIRASAIAPFVSFLNQTGAPVDKFLANSNVPRKSLDETNSLIPMPAVTNFISLSARAETIPTLGLLVGQQTMVDQLGSYGRLVQSSLTLYEALDTGQKQMAAFNSCARLWLERRGHLAWFCHRYLSDFGEGGHHGSQCTIMLVMNLVRLAAGPQWKPTAIHLQMPYKAEVSRYEAFSDIPLVFGQTYSAIAMPAKLLGLPLRQPVKDSAALLQQEAEQLARTAPALDLSGSLRQLLHTHMRDGYPGIHRVADSAGTSARTLQRRLEEEGLRYSRLLEEVRFELATQLMDDPSVKLGDIAFELGYRDYANFTRAFRRWAGVPPTEFRKLRLGNE